MIGTRLDETDAPRLVRGEFGWWFIGNNTWTLIRAECVHDDGRLDDEVDTFLTSAGAYRRSGPRCFSLTVLTTTACNLGCGYCFQNTAPDASGGDRPPRIEKQWLDSKIVERIICFTAERMDQAGLREA